MRSRAFGRTLAVLAVVAAAGCSSSGNTPAVDSLALHACSTQPTQPVSQVPSYHRATAPTCDVTPAEANSFTYDAAGKPCTSDDTCNSPNGPRGHCLRGACSIDECLSDDDCGTGRACMCSDHTPNSAIVNSNFCVSAECRTDSDCGAGGFCMPSAGVCFTAGLYCHTAADTCVDAAADCPASCVSMCTYFPSRHAFACPAPWVGGC